MNSNQRIARLNKYYDLLSDCPAAEQSKVIERKRTPEVLRAFLSAQAPMELMERFAYRYGEVLDKPFSPYERGRINAATGELELAKKHFETAIHNGDKRGLMGIAEMLPPMMDFEKMNYLKVVIASGADFAEAYAKLGDLYLVQEQTGMAIECFSKAGDKSISSVIKKYYEAEVLWSEGKKKESLEIHRELAAKGHFRSIEKLVELNGEWGEHEKSIEILRNGIACGHDVLLLRLARVYEELGDADSAGKTYVEAFEAGYFSALTDAVNHLIKNKSFETALEFCDRVIEDGEAVGHIVAMKVYGAMGEEEPVEQHLRCAIDLGYPVPFELEFGLLIREGNVVEAIELCEEKVKTDPRYYFFLASLYGEQGDNVAAMRAYESAIVKNGLIEVMKIVLELYGQGKQEAANQIMGGIIVEFMSNGLLPQLKREIMTRMGITGLN